MKYSLIVLFLTFFVSTANAKNSFCALTLNNDPFSTVSMELKFDSVFEQTVDVYEDSNYKVNAFASNGEMAGLIVSDKNSKIVFTSQGKMSVISNDKGIEFLRINCINQ